MNNVFVYCELEGTTIADVSLELLTKGRKLANQLNCQLEAIVAGSGLEGIEKQVMPYGVDKVHIFDAPGLFPYTSLPHSSVLINLFKEEKPQICLMGATVIGRDLGPRVSSALTSGLTADCTSLEIGSHEDKRAGKTYENLITCEVLCHGVGSTKFFEDVIKDYQLSNNSKVKNVLFRDKKGGWEDSYFTVFFENGKRKSSPSYYNTFGYPFSRGYISRESCLNCKYSSEMRVADITLGDYAGKDKNHYSSKQKKMGISLVLASTEKGKKVLKELEATVEFDEKDILKISESNPALRQKAHNERKRNKFFDVYLNDGYDSVKLRCATPSKEIVFRHKYRRQINFVYNILKKLKLK